MSQFYVATMSHTWTYADMFVENTCHILYFGWSDMQSIGKYNVRMINFG